MQHSERSNTIATGLAMFSMFFGAGNVVFPLALGQFAQNQNFFAILGLLLTAVAVPFTGLIAMTLFNGDYKSFFARLGRVPGFIVAAAIMGLIGPFGAIPRCITLSFATVQLYFPDLSLPIFSFISCIVIFLLTIRRNNILEELGYYLSPLLIASLAIIIIKGMITSPSAPEADHLPWTIFWTGFLEGYKTMDLMGAFFFSSVILACLERDVDTSNPNNTKRMIKLTLKASAIGATLLAIAYIGFSYVAAFNSLSLVDARHDQLAGKVAILVLGPYASLIACLVVAVACLTTAIALSAVFAEFVHKDLTLNKVGYGPSLIATLVITFLVSTLDFTGIASFLLPILEVCYPALITLSVFNIAHKLWGWKIVKLPVLLVFLVSLAFHFREHLIPLIAL